MFGFIEFKKQDHDENLQLVHRIKEDICKLVDKLSHGNYHERQYQTPEFDERRGGGKMGNRGSMGYHGTEGSYGSGHHMPYHYPYPQHPMYPQDQQYDDRYNY